jgi:hypothetical protein
VCVCVCVCVCVWGGLKPLKNNSTDKGDVETGSFFHVDTALLDTSR